MKIVQAVGWYFPESLGGSEVYVAGLCRRLRQGGDEVLIAAPDPGADRERTYQHEGTSVYRYPVSSSATREEAQGLVAARGAERLHAWLARQRPDVVHVHSFVTGLGLRELRAARAAGARVVATSHSGSLGFICQRGTMMRWGERLCDGLAAPSKCAACALERRGLPRPLARALGAIPPAAGRGARALPGRLGTALGMSELIARNQVVQREMLAVVDAFVVLTGWAREAVLANGAPPAKVALNRLGVSHDRVVAKPDPRRSPTTPPVRVGYLGRLDPIKGVSDLARAAAGLPRDVPIAVEFRAPVGGRAEREVARELEALAGGDPRIRFAPAVAPADALGALGGYDVLCCPSRCLEGGPTVAIEAHAVGTPVIGTRIGGLAELVTDGVNGRLVPPGDWRALGEVLREIARDPRGTIDRWRAALPPPRTMDEVAADTRALYARALARPA